MTPLHDACLWVLLLTFCTILCNGVPVKQTRDTAVGDGSNHRRTARRVLGNTAVVARATMKRSTREERSPVELRDKSGSMRVVVQKSTHPVQRSVDVSRIKQILRDAEHKRDGGTRSKRILDVILGSCGAFGCTGNSNSSPGEFDYGYTGNDDYSSSQSDHNALGYWVECEDDPDYECYYYYSDVYDDNYYDF